MEVTTGSETQAPSTTETPSVTAAPVEVSASPSPPTTVSEPAQGAQTPAVVSAQPQAPAFTPKFKITADNKEFEIPEMYRGLIKDAESQKQVQEIFEKAHGLDTVKGRFHQTRDEYKQFKEQVTPILSLAKELDYYQKKGDLGSYFKALGFNDQQIMQYALDRAQQMELSPEQKRVYDERELANRQQYELESQFQQTQAQLQQLMVQQRNVELQSVISRPDVSNFVSAFDRRNGQGSFAQECVQRGRAHFALTGQDITADQVVQEIIKKFDSPISQPTPPQAPRAPVDVPVIPNTGSGSSSPAQKAFKTLDDVRKYKTEMFG